MFVPLKTKVGLRRRVRCDDDDDCDCPPPAYEPLWQALLVALTPVALTAVLELWIDKRKREADADADAPVPPKPKRRAR